MIELLAILLCVLIAYLWMGFMTALFLSVWWDYMSWQLFVCVMIAWPSYWRC